MRISLYAAALSYPVLSTSQREGSGSPYAPVYVDCPSDLRVRNASDGLSYEETLWRDARAGQVMPALQAYLELAAMPDFDIQGYMNRLNASSMPIVGLSVSGGGTQSGLGGLGVWQAFDARYEPAVEARTGGLAQILTYLTGLSGGGAVAISLLAANNFTAVEEIVRRTDFSTSYTQGRSGNETAFLETIFENTGAKAEAGFTVSVADTFGQFWGTWLPADQVYADYATLADRNSSVSAFIRGAGPMPIMVFAEVVPGESPEIGRIAYPGRNATDGFTLTSYEVTPLEFGSWAGGRVQAFMSTRWLGSAMVGGEPVNGSDGVCVEGFDKLTVMQGTTTDAFAAYLIDDFYDVPIFARRDGGMSIPIPPGQKDNEFVQLVNQTAETFGQTFNESLWATYPNPFLDYNDDMRGVRELLLADGSLTGETNPIRPLIIPDRQVDFLIVYEASSDAPYSWVNGTNLINSAQSAAEGNLPFPAIPDVTTMVLTNLTHQPTLFGCNDTSVPLVLYLPNSPWSAYSNFSFRQDAFTTTQLDATLDNAFQLATYGNGKVDDAWPVCLACAVVRRSLGRLGISMPGQCDDCFSQHCWDGTTVTGDVDVDEAYFDLTLRLEPGTGFEEWNRTVWSGGAVVGDDGDGTSTAREMLGEGTTAYAMAVAVAVSLFVNGLD